MAAPTIALKALRFDYYAVASRTGLTDVKGQVFVNGVAKAVGTNAVVFSELDSTNAKGLYTYLATPATLASWGIAASGENSVEIFTNSATLPGPTPIKLIGQVATADDIIALLGSPFGSTIAGDILSVYNRIGAPSAASVSADIAALAAAQSTMTAQLQALQNAANTGGAGVVSLQAQIPTTGTYGLLVPVTIRDGNGNLVAPSSISVSLQNQSGTDRGSYLTGASGSPATLTPTPVSTGIYSIPVVIPTSAVEEQLVGKITFVVNGKTDVQFFVIDVVVDVAGVAQQSTVTAIATNVSTLLSKINDATNGLVAINNNVSSAVSAAQTAATNAQNAYTSAQAANTAIATANSALTGIQGAGFATGTNSLVALTNLVLAIPTSYAKGV